jgi:hypothetical protein
VICNLGVVGSNPTRGSKKEKHLGTAGVLFLRLFF